MTARRPAAPGWLAAGLAHVVLLLGVVAPAPAWAHSGGVSYVDLERDAGSWLARIDLPLPDAADELALDADGDGALRWGEILAAQSTIVARLADRLSLRTGSADCPARADGAPQLVRRASGAHLRIALRYACGRPGAGLPTLDAGPWFTEVADHGLLVRVAGGGGSIALLNTASHALVLPASGAADGWRTAVRFAALGAEHLVTGYDHLAFLALLLIGVLRGSGLRPRRMLVAMASVATAFTLAHSLTLALAALDLVRLPASLVEAAIAASIVITATTLALHRGWTPDWRIAFGVGLVHGLGFAGQLGELLDGRATAVPLAAFNLGLEAAQLGLLLLALPAMLWLGRRPDWSARLTPPLSWGLAVCGSVWLWQRL